MNKSTEQENFDKLVAIIVDAMRVNPSRVVREARIFHDLGAESIDILDIRFRIEHMFGIKIDQDEIARSLGEGFTVEEFKEKFTVGSLAEFVQTKTNSIT